MDRHWDGPDTLGDYHLMLGADRLGTAKPNGMWRSDDGSHYGVEKDLETAKIAVTAAHDAETIRPGGSNG